MDVFSALGLKNNSLNFLNLDGEEILLALRPHYLTLIPSLILLTALTAVFLASIIGISMFIPISPLNLNLILAVIIFNLFLLAKVLLDWYFHFYIITDRKILELSYSPLGSCLINDILLDQVKCTEVDMQTPNLFYQFFDIGHISITFDRPTHKQQFIMENIQDYRQIGTHLGKILVHGDEKTHEKAPEAEAMWIRDRTNPSKYSYTEEISPIRR